MTWVYLQHKWTLFIAVGGRGHFWTSHCRSNTDFNGLCSVLKLESQSNHCRTKNAQATMGKVHATKEKQTWTTIPVKRCFHPNLCATWKKLFVAAFRIWKAAKCYKLTGLCEEGTLRSVCLVTDIKTVTAIWKWLMRKPQSFRVSS